MESKSNLSDEFIYDSFVKAVRFNLTLTVSTIAVILALFKLSKAPIEISISLGLMGVFFLAAIILSVLEQLMGTRQIIEKVPAEKIDAKFILGGLWAVYVLGVFTALNSLVEIAKNS